MDVGWHHARGDRRMGRHKKKKKKKKKKKTGPDRVNLGGAHKM